MHFTSILSYIYMYGSEYESTLLLNTVPIPIRIHNTVWALNWHAKEFSNIDSISWRSHIRIENSYTNLRIWAQLRTIWVDFFSL